MIKTLFNRIYTRKNNFNLLGLIFHEAILPCYVLGIIIVKLLFSPDNETVVQMYVYIVIIIKISIFGISQRDVQGAKMHIYLPAYTPRFQMR